MDRFLSEQTLGIEKLRAELETGNKYDQEEQKRERDLIFPTVFSIGAALRLGALLLVFSSIRSLRRLSERTADLAAVLYSDGLTLICALERFGGKGNKGLFALHPSTKWRIALIRRALGMTGTSDVSLSQSVG